MILTPDQQRTYRRDGVVFGIPVYTGSDLQSLQETFAAFKAYPEKSEDGSPLSFRLLGEEPIWRVATHPTTVWLAVHDATRQNAAMHVIPGSQK